MKKKGLIGGLLTVFILTGCVGCTQQTMTREYGGEMSIELPVNQKLEEITWKDDHPWYLTRPMREDEAAETHTFQESSSWGVWEGTVTVIEKKSGGEIK